MRMIFFDFEIPVWICSKIVKTFIIQSSQYESDNIYFKNDHEKAEITDFETSCFTQKIYKRITYLSTFQIDSTLYI